MVMILQLKRAWDRKFTAAAQTLNLLELNQQSDYGEFCHKKKKKNYNAYSYEWSPWTPPSIWADVDLFSNLSSPEYIMALHQIKKNIQCEK